MGLFLDHVNVVLQKLRADPVTSLSTDTTTEAYRAQTAVNRALARVWNYKQWSFKRRSDTITTVSGTGSYTLPRNLPEPYSVISSGFPYKLEPTPKHLFDLMVPNPTETGNPRNYILSDMVGVTTQMTADSVVTVVSSSAVDTTQTVLVKGIVSGQVDYEAVSLNGTTSASTSKTFSSVLSVTKSANTSGRVTITAGATTVLVMGPNEKSERFRTITFYPTPSSALTITLYGFALPPLLTHAYEESQIPERWDYIVDQWGFIFALQAKGQDQGPEFNTETQFGLTLLNDMDGQEAISAEEPILPLKAGEGGYANQWIAPPSGTSFIQE